MMAAAAQPCIFCGRQQLHFGASLRLVHTSADCIRISAPHMHEYDTRVAAGDSLLDAAMG